MRILPNWDNVWGAVTFTVDTVCCIYTVYTVAILKYITIMCEDMASKDGESTSLSNRCMLEDTCPTVGTCDVTSHDDAVEAEYSTRSISSEEPSGSTQSCQQRSIGHRQVHCINNGCGDGEAIRRPEPHSPTSAWSACLSDTDFSTAPLRQYYKDYDIASATYGDISIYFPISEIENLSISIQSTSSESVSLPGLAQEQTGPYNLNKQNEPETEIKRSLSSTHCKSDVVEQHLLNTEEAKSKVRDLLKKNEAGELQSLEAGCICLKIAFHSILEINNFRDLVTQGHLNEKLAEIFLSIPKIFELTKGNLLVKEIEIPNQLSEQSAENIVYTKCSRVNAWFWTMDYINWMHVALTSIKGNGKDSGKEVPQSHTVFMQSLHQNNPGVPSSEHQSCPICKVLKHYDLRAPPKMLVTPSAGLTEVMFLCKTEIYSQVPVLLRTMVLIGRTGSGKSSTANAILGRQSGMVSNSQETSFGKRVFPGREVMVVDTETSSVTNKEPFDKTKEFMKCLTLTSQGIHALICVFDAGKITSEDQKVLKYFMNVFGDNLHRYLIILFTHGDLHKDLTIDEYVEGIKAGENSSLKDLLTKCGSHYISFHNNESRQDEKVAKLIEMTDEIVDVNGGEPFRIKFHEEAEKIMQKKIKNQLKIEKEYPIGKDVEKRGKEIREQIQKDTEANTGDTLMENFLVIGKELQSLIINASEKL